jgi:hypothetical protein
MVNSQKNNKPKFWRVVVLPTKPEATSKLIEEEAPLQQPSSSLK